MTEEQASGTEEAVELPVVGPAPAPPPPAPWALEGSGVISPWLVDAGVARNLVPEPFELIELLPGLTLGSLFTLSYASSPAGAYDEVGFAPALVGVGGERGFYVSHLYADTRRSVEGGRANWGLPKELADVGWRKEDHTLWVELQRQGEVLGLLETRQRGAALPARGSLPLLTLLDGRPHLTIVRLRARLAPGSTRFRVAKGSPLEGLGLRFGLPSLWAWEAQLEVGPARSVASGE